MKLMKAILLAICLVLAASVALAIAVTKSHDSGETPAPAGSGSIGGIGWTVSAFKRNGGDCVTYEVSGGPSPSAGTACLGSSGYPGWLQPAYIALGDPSRSMVVATFVGSDVAALRLKFGLTRGHARWVRLRARQLSPGASEAAGFSGPMRVVIGAVRGIDTGSPLACLKRVEVMSASDVVISRSPPMFCANS
jgi:hypothetical protein